MGKIDTSYFDTKGRYEKFAKRYGVTILYVNKIPYHNNEVLFEHTQTLEVEQFFALAEEKNVKSVLCEIKYFEASDFYVDFDEMLRLMYIFKNNEGSFNAVENACLEYDKQFSGYENKNGNIAFHKLMFTCENIQYVIEASDTWYKELVSKQQTFQDMIASYNKKQNEQKKQPKRFSIS
ncbi:hypothetical protein ACS2QQ_27375 [Bacillus cereus group sp. Bce032]|uniref:hypothetical protein n=1 Tax=Bacillus cereus group sp. Bce032 TaxID=3445236 RepID=UPI003F20B782